MSGKLLLKIVTPDGFLFTEEVDEVTAPGTEGEFGVFPGHIPFITTLNTGAVKYKKEGSAKEVYVTSGYVEAGPEKVLILADSAEIRF